MLVVHGCWAYGALSLWAEDSARPAQAPPPAGRPSRAPRAHPFAVPADPLADALAAAFPGPPVADLAGQAIGDELTLRLPSTPAGPLASPGLVRPPDREPAVPGRVALAPWRVPALVIEPAGAAPALLALAGQPPGDLTAGAEVGYLAAAARFAADLAARGRVLPALVREDDDAGYAARWRPVLAGADARYARELAAAQPAACRAAEDAASGPLLAGLLDALADAAVRARRPGPLLAPRRGRRPARTDLAERVLPALTSPDGRVELAGPLDEQDAAALAAEFDDWLASAARPASAVRTCFRLTEPPAPSALPEPPAPPALSGPSALPEPPAPSALPEPPAPSAPSEPPARSDVTGPAARAGRDEPAGRGWRVEFSLQSADDPSLMVPAADV